MAMQVGKGSLGAVEQVWQSQAATAAQDAGQKANSEGMETSQRGIDISELTQRAAAVVQQGNAQLTTIATSFASQAVALAPVIMTPPAQATLMATATEHLGQAVSVVNATRGDLAGKTAELNGLVSQLVGQNGPAPAEIAQAVMQNVGEPLMSQAEEVATTAAGFDSGTSATNGLSTSAASYGSGGSAGSGGGAGAFGTGGFGRGGSGGSAGRAGSGGVAGIPSLPGTSGAPGGVALPGGMRAPVAGMPMGAGLGTTPASSSGFMGGPGAAGAAGQRNNNEDEHSRNVDPYRSRTGNDDLTGPLGESTPRSSVPPTPTRATGPITTRTSSRNGPPHRHDNGLAPKPVRGRCLRPLHPRRGRARWRLSERPGCPDLGRSRCRKPACGRSDTRPGTTSAAAPTIRASTPPG